MPISCRVGHSATPAILVDWGHRHLAWSGRPCAGMDPTQAPELQTSGLPRRGRRGSPQGTHHCRRVRGRNGSQHSCRSTQWRAKVFRELFKKATERRRCCGFLITNQVVIIGCCLSGGSCRSWAHSSPSRLFHWLSAPRIRCGTRVSRLLSARNLGRLSFRRACSVVMMMTYGSPHPDAGDVTGNVQPTAPVRAEQVTKPPSKRITLLQRRSRKVLHQRAKKEARVANVFGAQQARRTAKPDMKFNAVY
jgi:hypothetical protein